MFFTIESQGNPGINYNRYESNQVAIIEKVLAEILNINLEKSALLVTSSGMAAYTLLESYLIRYVLRSGDKIYLPHAIYFEIEEQITKLPHVEIIQTETRSIPEISSYIVQEQPRIVFLDPLSNTGELRMTDIKAILETVANQLIVDVYIMIDGTMISGGMDIEALRCINPHIKIFYYESCSKYLQLGLDIAMGGLIAVPVELQPFFDRLRRNTGTIMYDIEAKIFPIYDRTTHQKRMKRFSRNARIIGEMIAADDALSGKVTPHFPGLPSHSDYTLAQQYPWVGGIITFSFTNPYLNQRDSLNSFIEIALVSARDKNVSLTQGLSFGFSIPRISAATAMAENSPPFLRLSVGDRSYKEVVKLSQSLISAFKTYIDLTKWIEK